MRKTYKIGEVANILGVSADTIRYYEKEGIVYSRKDPENGYRYFTSSDVYAMMDVLFYRSMEIPIEEVRNIMNVYRHKDVKKLLEEKEKQISEKIKAQKQLLARIHATIQDYQIMEENLDVYKVQPVPPMIVFSETPADSQAYFNSMSERESRSLAQTIHSSLDQGFAAVKKEDGWEMVRLFAIAPLQQAEDSKFLENSRVISLPKVVYTVQRFPWGKELNDLLRPALDWVAEHGFSIEGEILGQWVFTDYSQEPPLDYVALYIPVR